MAERYPQTVVLRVKESARWQAAATAIESMRREPWRHRLSRVRPVAARVLLPVALILWVLSLRHVRLDAMNDLGLVSALPILYWAALATLTVGFTVALADLRLRTAWLAGYVLSLIALLHATPSVLYPTLRYSWAWKHVAVTTYLVTYGGTNPNAGELAAYNQWPGFFALNALILKATGLHSALQYAAWAPPVVNAAMIVPLLLIFGTFTRERWLVWGGVWICLSGSWVGQDYFSPQAYALLLYLVLIAIVLRHGPRPALLASGVPPDGPVPRPGIAQTLLICMSVLLIATIESSHQLTPLLAITTLAGLALVHRTRLTTTLLIAAVAGAAAWDATVALPFMKTNLHSLLQSFGTLDANAGSGVIALQQASPGQVLVAEADRALSALLCALGVAGFILRPQVRRAALLVLAVSPIPLLIGNSYGGEIIYRVYLFALPACALCAAALVCRPPRLQWIGAAARCAAFLVLLSGFVLAYYGKEQENYFTPAEVKATDVLFATAPPGSLIVAATSNFPGAYTRYEQYEREWFGLQTPQLVESVTNDAADTLAITFAAEPDRPGFVILTRSQQAESDMTGLFPRGAFARIEQSLNSSGLFTVVYRNADAVVYEYGSPGAPGGGLGG